MRVKRVSVLHRKSLSFFFFFKLDFEGISVFILTRYNFRNRNILWKTFIYRKLFINIFSDSVEWNALQLGGAYMFTLPRYQNDKNNNNNNAHALCIFC